MDEFNRGGNYPCRTRAEADVQSHVFEMFLRKMKIRGCFFILLVGLVIFSGAVYFKLLEDFLDLADNFVDFKDSDPSE